MAICSSLVAGELEIGVWNLNQYDTVKVSSAKWPRNMYTSFRDGIPPET
jgi:hypothetical protein